jgi:hypothetical protein
MSDLINMLFAMFEKLHEKVQSVPKVDRLGLCKCECQGLTIQVFEEWCLSAADRDIVRLLLCTSLREQVNV